MTTTNVNDKGRKFGWCLNMNSVFKEEQNLTEQQLGRLTKQRRKLRLTLRTI